LSIVLTTLFAYISGFCANVGNDGYREAVAALFRGESDETGRQVGAYCEVPDGGPKLGWEAGKEGEGLKNGIGVSVGLLRG
jgi:hypothetical protein